MLKNNVPGSVLFYLPGDGFEAAVSKGEPQPVFNARTSLVPDGPFGGAISCDNKVRLSYKAPGNVYGERGTLSFFWRARYEVGPTAFPIFRVGFADHSSWDGVFLRIDWNGEGFEAFVSDANLSRARVWYEMPGKTLDPEKWYHLALSWDENWGIKLYLDGEKIAEEYRPAVYFTGLDQFGPHSRAISYWQVQSDYNFIRGGDIAELVFFDQQINDKAVTELSKGRFPKVDAFKPDLKAEEVKQEWTLRNGFDEVLKPIADHTGVRKVEVHDAYDLKRWWWKGCDGIRETTWPGVFNRSRLKGRKDYFQLPDWDCYSISGKAITFCVPDEPYNHIEISGSAYGEVEIVDEAGTPAIKLFTREKGKERTANDVPVRCAGKIRFTNEKMEEPIADFSLYHIYEGVAPEGVKRVSYKVKPGVALRDNALSSLSKFIERRYAPYERNRMTAVETGKRPTLTVLDEGQSFPFANILIPYQADDTLGLDGIELTMNVKKAGKYAVRIMDPLWYYRELAHFTFAASEGKKTLWFDTRDRVLPEGRSLYVTIAAEEVLPEDLEIVTVFKSAKDAKAEHCLDRFTQLRDAYGHMTEERPLQKEFALFNRYHGDMMDLLKVDPDHELGNYYLYDFEIHANARLGTPRTHDVKVKSEPVPKGVPAWAFRQVEYLKHYKKLINWYIDNRMIENGELGGGLSDDGDFVSHWFTLVNMDSDAEKVKRAIFRNTEAFYKQGMFTNGLCSIQADELHSSEEGLISLCSCLNAELGNPLWLERAMETARQVDWITGINKAGHRHFKSSFYNGSIMATEEPWGCQQANSFVSIGPAWQVARYTGNPKLLQMLKELADSQLAHSHEEAGGAFVAYIRFEDDQEMEAVNRRVGGERAMMIPASYLLNDDRYYNALPESRHGVKKTRFGGKDETETGVSFRPFKPGTDVLDKEAIAKRYEQWNKLVKIREFYNTEGSAWIDRIFFNEETLICERLGDPTDKLARYNYPTQTIAWKFNRTGDDERVAILSPVTERDHIKLIVANISDDKVFANVIGNQVDPGRWEVTYGVDTTGNDKANKDVKSFVAPFEWSVGVPVEFPAHTTTVVELTLKEAGVPYWDRCDLGVGPEDVKMYMHGLNVTIHSLGAQPTEDVEVVLKNRDGKVLKTAILPALPAPSDLWPRYRDVSFYLTHIDSLDGCYVEIDPEHKLCELTRNNNIVKLDGLEIL